MLVVIAMVLGLGAASGLVLRQVGLPGSPLTVIGPAVRPARQRGHHPGRLGRQRRRRGAARAQRREGSAAGAPEPASTTAPPALASPTPPTGSSPCLGLLPDHTTTIVLTDPAGSRGWCSGCQANGSSNIVFADRSGSTRAGLGVDTQGLRHVHDGRPERGRPARGAARYAAAGPVGRQRRGGTAGAARQAVGPEEVGCASS